MENRRPAKATAPFVPMVGGRVSFAPFDHTTELELQDALVKQVDEKSGKVCVWVPDQSSLARRKIGIEFVDPSRLRPPKQDDSSSSLRVVRRRQRPTTTPDGILRPTLGDGSVHRAGKKFMASAMREGWGQTKARSASSEAERATKPTKKPRSASSEAERSYQPTKKPRSMLSETEVMSTSSDAERATSHGNDGVLLRPRGGSNMITTGCCVQPQMCTAEPRGPSGMLGNGFYSSCCLGCCENDAPAPAEIRGGGYDSQSESGDDSGNEPEGSQIEDTE